MLDASKILSSSLDYNTTLKSVAQIAVPKIADWCTVDIIDNTGELQQLAISHIDPKKVKWAKEYRKLYPQKMSSNRGVPAIIKSGKSALVPLVTYKMLKEGIKRKKDLQIALELNLKSVMIVPISSHNKTVGAISFVSTNEAKLYTKEDLAIAEELASRSALAIENAQLYKKSQEEIEERKKLEAQKDEFIGVASHELKTPVTSLKAFGQVLQNKFAKEGNKASEDLLKKMDNQINKLNNLIEDLLDISKIESGRLQYRDRSFSFDELVDEVIEEVQRTTQKHKLIKKGKTDTKIFGDRERIGQVITNFLTNAIKYSITSDKITILSSKDEDKISFYVKDYGIGIPKNRLKNVFERFYRVKGKTQETVPGMGLGLYIASEIIKRHKGRIWAESKKGEGSKFCFTLPIKYHS